MYPPYVFIRRNKRMKKLLLVLAVLAVGYVSAYAGWIEENAEGCHNALYCGDLTIYDSITSTNYAVSYSSVQISNELYVSSSVHVALSTSSAIVPITPFVVVTATGVIDAIGSVPTIGKSLEIGRILILRGGSNTNLVILQDDGTCTGSKLQLGGTSRSLGLYDILGLIYDGGYWVEMFFINN